MKKILLALVALVSAAAFGATTVPVQLLNSTGSTSGQAVVSTGPTTAPGWSSIVDSVIAGSGITVSGATGNVTVSVASNAISLSQLAQQAANTVLANATGSTANVTAFSMPSCSTSTSALQWTSATGFTCFSGSAPLASPTFTGTPAAPTATAGTATTQLATTAFVTTSPTINQPNLVGVTNGSNAAAGSIGEYPTPSNLSGVSLTSTVAVNGSSIPLTAGDWDVSGVCAYSPAGTTTTSLLQAGISTTSATFSGQLTFVSQYIPTTAGAAGQLNSPTVRVSVSATTTTYLVCAASFATSTETVSGFMRARRIH